MKLQAMIERPPDVEIQKMAYLCNVLALMEIFAQAGRKICLMSFQPEFRFV